MSKLRQKMIRAMELKNLWFSPPTNSHKGSVNSVAFSPDGKIFASGSADSTIRLWDIPFGQKLNELHGHSGGIRSVAFHPDGSTLASGSYDNTVRLWNVADRKSLHKLSGHAGGIRSVAFHPKSKTLAFGAADKTIRLWDIDFYFMFLKNGKPTPLFHAIAEGVNFYWQIKRGGGDNPSGRTLSQPTGGFQLQIRPQVQFITQSPCQRAKQV